MTIRSPAETAASPSRSTIGGLWFFASQHRVDQRELAATVFAFAGLCGWACIVALNNLNEAFNLYADNLNRMDGPWKVTVKPVSQDGRPPRKRLSTLRAMRRLMVVATLASVAGAVLVAPGLLQGSPPPLHDL